MTAIRPIEQIAHNYARKSIMAFLECEKNTSEKWVIGIIGSSGVGSGEIESIITSLEGYGNPERYKFLKEFFRMD
jgi:hypothetical protein